MTVMLSVPTERAAPPKDLETRPKQVKAWIESLPLAQSVDAARKLVAHLNAVNRAKVDVDDRIQILEAYRPVATTLLDELEAVYSKATLPLAPRAREALALARSLAGELVIGTKICIAERGGKLLGFGAKKQLPMLVLRALTYIAALLKASYKSYTPVPEGVWRELHQTFLLAEQERVSAEIVDPDTKEAPINVYVECLLLALTDPYRLIPGEADKVLTQIRSARAPVTLSQTRPQTPTGGHFLVPCDTDKPPKPALSANDDTGGPNWRLLDANAIVEKIRMRQQAMATGNVSATTRGLMPPDMLALMAKLATLWGDPPKRAHRRIPTEGSVAICTGIKAIAHYLSLEEQHAAVEAESRRNDTTMPLRAPALDEDAQMVPIFEYSVINESEGGMKVRRVDATAQSIAVGEVVGLKRPGKAHSAIGVVRWVTVFEEGGMEFGVQFLAERARTVVVTPTIASSATQPRQGLQVFEEAGDEDGPLLTPINTFSDLREFELSYRTELAHVRAHGLIEKTARFELFHVQPS